uniref:Kinesin motor domain-containing protein n=1 Tax=Aegilops tauschii subsp. strangulata TaxID=200361 RepID=A0A452Z9M5_AEGTS
SLTPCKEDKSESPLRKALSPIPSNMMTPCNVNCPPSLELKTPIGACHIVEKNPDGTPLDKFNALGSNLKVCMIFSYFVYQQPVLVQDRSLKISYVTQESLIQQYLEFLNVANKEELQQLKGIGEKRAEYILELREDSPRPFQSLSDLGNIGLSTKQIQDILRKTATGIFK